MGLLDEVEKLMSGSMSSVNYRTINLGGRALYIEGIKSVVSFGVDEMQFQMKKGVLKVSGVDLCVKYLDKTTCMLEGNIISVVVL